MTVGSPTRLILAFSLPLLIGNFFQQAFVLADSAIVGRMIGVDALAAVGATGKMLFLLIGFSWGATAGLAIPVSNAFGAGDMATVRRNVGASAIVSALIAIVITTVGVIYGPALLRLINTPPELLEMAQTYQSIMFAGASLTVAYNWLASVVRAVGDSRTPLYFLIVSSFLNAGLSILLVGQFQMGVAGTAYGTIITQSITMFACLIYVFRKMPEIFPSKAELRESIHHLWTPARIGLPMGFQASVIAIGTTLMQAAINGLGADAVAAATVAARIEGLAMMPLGTFGVAMATFVAQNYGAKKYGRIRSAVLRMSIISMVSGVILGVVLYAFSNEMVGLFLASPSAEVISLVQMHFRIGGFWYFALGMIFIMRNAIQGLGFATIPTLSGFVELAVRSISALFFVGTFGWTAVVWGLPMGWTLGAALCTVAWFYHRRRLVALQREQDARPFEPVVSEPVSELTLVTAA